METLIREKAQLAPDITLVRVDERLVHGQILEAWVPFIHASRIVVVNDAVANDSFRVSAIKMAVPREVEVAVYRIKDFALNYSYSRGGGVKTIVLFSSIADALNAFTLGFKFDRLNIGNIHAEKQKKRCSSSVTLGENDIHDIRALLDAGIQIGVRHVPRGRFTDIRNFIKIDF
jgi:PTS system mannose-specific IIB component